MGKILPFTRKPAADDPQMDVCLAKGAERRRYTILAVSGSTWESRIEDGSRVERCLMSRRQALERKAEMELRIATELTAGWTVERNR